LSDLGRYHRLSGSIAPLEVSEDMKTPSGFVDQKASFRKGMRFGWSAQSTLGSDVLAAPPCVDRIT